MAKRYQKRGGRGRSYRGGGRSNYRRNGGGGQRRMSRGSRGRSYGGRQQTVRLVIQQPNAFAPGMQNNPAMALFTPQGLQAPAAAPKRAKF